MTERKIIQIAMAAYQGVGCIALCDDGTLWTKYGLLDDEPWKQIKAIPQPEPLPPTEENAQKPATQEELASLIDRMRRRAAGAE